MFKSLLAHSGHPIDQAKFERDTRNYTPAERIQTLINKLSNEVLSMDLSHINGEKIIKGDVKHISDMLQLLEALWQNYNNHPSDGEEEDEALANKMESDLNDNDSLHQEDELNDPSKRQQNSKSIEKNTVAKKGGELYDRMVQDGGLAASFKPAPGIPVYTEDPINFKDMVLEPKYGVKVKPKKTLIQGAMAAAARQQRPKTSTITSKKAEVVKRIEDNVYGVRRDRVAKTRTLVKDVS